MLILFKTREEKKATNYDTFLIVIEINLYIQMHCESFRLANFTDEKLVVQSAGGSGINEYVANQFDPTLNWTDVEWLVQ